MARLPLPLILLVATTIGAAPDSRHQSLAGKVMCGYQGWFAAPGDGANVGWRHYAGRHGKLAPGSCTFDLWPDLSEFDPDEKFPTTFRHADGSTAHLFSSYRPKTVRRHFTWMQTHGIDGVFLQRFANPLRHPKLRHHADRVLANVRTAAAASNRSWALMYDLSGLNAGEIETILLPDLRQLLEDRRITADPTYLHHNGKPLVAVWGIGFNDNRNYTLAECDRLITALKALDLSIMLGIPAYWRTLDRDALADAQLHAIITKADVISPWTVGRYQNPDQVQRHAKETLAPDLAWTHARQIDYLPVIFPGFSWQNLKASHGETAPLNHIPRLKGQFLWSQAVAAKRAGADMLYVAMFDEIDEGTAIFKCTNDPPVGKSNFLTYENLPSDHYLWLTGQITRLIRNQIPPTHQQPRRNATP